MITCLGQRYDHMSRSYIWSHIEVTFMISFMGHIYDHLIQASGALGTMQPKVANAQFRKLILRIWPTILPSFLDHLPGVDLDTPGPIC